MQDKHLGVQCHLDQGQHAHAQRQGQNISGLDPALQKQWDHAENAHLGDIDIRPHSNRKVWWICDQCPDATSSVSIPALYKTCRQYYVIVAVVLRYS